MHARWAGTGRFDRDAWKRHVPCMACRLAGMRIRPSFSISRFTGHFQSLCNNATSSGMPDWSYGHPDKRTPDLRHAWKQCRWHVCCSFRPDVFTALTDQHALKMRSLKAANRDATLDHSQTCRQNASARATLHVSEHCKPCCGPSLFFSYSAFGFSYVSLSETHYNETPLKKQHSAHLHFLNHWTMQRYTESCSRIQRPSKRIWRFKCTPPFPTHSHYCVTHPTPMKTSMQNYFAPVTWQLFTFG